MNDNPLFGPMLREARKGCGIPIWKVAAKTPHHQGNIQRIERGITEPRIGLAMRLLIALNVDVGIFMESLALKAGWHQRLAETRSLELVDGKLLLTSPSLDKTVYPFGRLLRETRVASGKSQKAIATEAGYTVRNLITVESGRQEPRVMTALKLVCATDCDIVYFFNELAAIYRQENSTAKV